MIEEGKTTLIDNWPYLCVKIVGNTAHLKRVGEESRGRFKKMSVKLCPYFDENNEYIVPEPPPINRKRMTRFHFMKVIKENVDMPLSHDLAYFVAEWLETIVYMTAGDAEDNAKKRGDERITAAHWPPYSDMKIRWGYWPENRDYAKDYKQYLKEGGE